MLSVLLVLLLVTPGAAHQQPTGSIFGIISDPTGEVLPGARIVVTGDDTRTREVHTNALGRFTLDALPPGRYRVEASMAGFDTKIGAVAVRAGQVANWSGALLLAGAIVGEESIETRVRRETGWDAVDCGRYAVPVDMPHLEKALTCARDSAKQRQPFAVIVQHATKGTRSGYGLFAAGDGHIQRFEYERGGMTFRIEPCADPHIAASDKFPPLRFSCERR